MIINSMLLNKPSNNEHYPVGVNQFYFPTDYFNYVGSIIKINVQNNVIHKVVEHYADAFIERYFITTKKDPYNANMIHLVDRIFTPYEVNTVIDMNVFNNSNDKISIFKSIPVTKIEPLNYVLLMNTIQELNNINVSLANFVSNYIKPKLNNLKNYCNTNFRFIIPYPLEYLQDIQERMVDLWYMIKNGNEPHSALEETIDDVFDPRCFSESPYFQNKFTNILHNRTINYNDITRNSFVNKGFNKNQFSCNFKNGIQDLKRPIDEWMSFSSDNDLIEFLEMIIQINATDFGIEITLDNYKNMVNCEKLFMMNRYFPHHECTSYFTHDYDFEKYPIFTKSQALLNWIFSKEKFTKKDIEIEKIRVIKTYNEDLFILIYTDVDYVLPFVIYLNMLDVYLSCRDIIHYNKNIIKDNIVQFLEDNKTTQEGCETCSILE